MSYNSLGEDNVNCRHPRKQEILNRIMKMRNFLPLYIKLCTTIDYSWIDTLSSVIDKIDESLNRKKTINWILSECEPYDDIRDCAISHMNIFQCCTIL